MPHDTDTERAVLATLIRYNEKYAEVSDLLSEDLFWYDLEKSIYRTVAGLIEAGNITDINALCDWAGIHEAARKPERGDFLAVMQLPSKATLTQDIMRLRTMRDRREGWAALQQAAQNMLDGTKEIDETINGAVGVLTDMQSACRDDGIATFADAIDELTEIVMGNASGKRAALTTGYRIFDSYYLLRPGTLTVIAAFTSVGKSALAMNIAVNVAKRGTPVAYYSLEMGKAELASRALSKDVESPASAILNEHLPEANMHYYMQAAENYRSLPIYIDERSTVSFDRTVRSIRTISKTRKVRLAVIDYLQIYTQTSDNVEASLGQMARQAKNVAKETGIALILLSQLNRSGLHPSINMMRGSGQIEESADNIVLIDRPEAYPDNKVKSYEGTFDKESIEGTAKLILAKGRGVGTGCDLLLFNRTNTTFTDRYRPAPETEEEEPLPF